MSHRTCPNILRGPETFTPSIHHEATSFSNLTRTTHNQNSFLLFQAPRYHSNTTKTPPSSYPIHLNWSEAHVSKVTCSHFPSIFETFKSIHEILICWKVCHLLSFRWLVWTWLNHWNGLLKLEIQKTVCPILLQNSNFQNHCRWMYWWIFLFRMSL